MQQHRESNNIYRGVFDDNNDFNDLDLENIRWQLPARAGRQQASKYSPTTIMMSYYLGKSKTSKNPMMRIVMTKDSIKHLGWQKGTGEKIAMLEDPDNKFIFQLVKSSIGHTPSPVGKQLWQLQFRYDRKGLQTFQTMEVKTKRLPNGTILLRLPFTTR